jgi:uncharacterized membrane protein YcaP (DUF421 family)
VNVDPLRIAIRVVFAYLVLLALVRSSGKRTVKQGSPFDFTIALILGDMFDDAIWAEVAVSQFVVACGMLLIAHVSLDWMRFRSGSLR